MEANFWHERWQSNEIGFHGNQANPLLVANFKRLGLQVGQRVFLPLCGKTLDIHWLLAQGQHVAGAELSEIAIQQLFAELELTPKITSEGQLLRYSSPAIDIFVGDIFDLTPEQLGPVDAIYDRAALVALPTDLRQRYSAHLMALTQTAPQLLICFEYDQSLIEGPPFSIADAEVAQHYQADYAFKLLSQTEMAGGGLRGKYPAEEKVWLLQ